MPESTPYIACIAEGGAENAIMNILLDNDLLIFNRERMLDEAVLNCRSAKDFEERYLRKGFTDKITVYRILDSRREKFNLSKAYRHNVEVVNVVTAPEIEMLIILNEKRYEEFKRSGLKPSEFCKSVLGFKRVKSPDFVLHYFSDPGTLLFAIQEYNRVSSIQRDEKTLLDLIRK